MDAGVLTVVATNGKLAVVAPAAVREVEEVKEVNGPVNDDSVVDTAANDDSDDDGEDLADRTGSVFVPYIRSTQSCRVARPRKC